MGIVFGKTGVEEPAFELLLKQSQGFSYEVRKYGVRFAAETELTIDNGAFSVLARYIGVFGEPENEGKESITMTAPVVKETKPMSIAMTAPVVKSQESDDKKVMQFYLPAEYDSLSKIPRPTNPKVIIKKVPISIGAVHRYSGSFSDDMSRQKVTQLALQLREDGVEEMTEDFALKKFLWLGYNPPFTLPPFRRNEVWLPLTPEQAERLVKGYVSSEAN
jgi:hypothetical protein